MALPDGMQTLATRLASFESTTTISTTKQKGKKRTSTKNKKPTSAWPLESPAPEQLAQAGFFFTATSTSPDNVTCFCCRKSLDEWDEGDDPFREHLQFAPECAWAVTMAVERGVIAKDDDHDPLAEEFVEMRTATFGSLWPHEGKKAWTPKVKKLVDAGWHYFPTPEEEDQTKCAYCSLCVSGWEPKDKPLEEHKRRAPECPFFHLTALHKKTRPKKSRASKASRVSNISIATWTKEPSMMVDEEVNIDDSIMTTATDITVLSTATTATRKSTRAKKSTAKAATGKKAQENIEEAMELEEDKENDRSLLAGEKSTRSRKRSSAVMLDDDEDEVIPAPKKRTARGRSTTARPITPPAAKALSPVAAKSTAEIEEHVSEEILAEEVVVEETRPDSIMEDSTPQNHGDEPEEIDLHSKEAREPEPLAIPKRGAKGKRIGGSTTSRKASGTKSRKATGTRKVSVRTASNASKVTPELQMDMELDDAEIEARLEADLNRPLSDEELLYVPEEEPPVKTNQTKEEQKLEERPPHFEQSLIEQSPDVTVKPEKTRAKLQGRGKQSTAKGATSRAASRIISQPKAEPKKFPIMADESEEEDELAETYNHKPAVNARKLFSNPYETRLDDVKLSDDESDGSVIVHKTLKKGAKKSSIAPAAKPKRGRPPKKAAPKAEAKEEDKSDEEIEAPRQQRGSRVMSKAARSAAPTELRFSSSFEDSPSMLEADADADAAADETRVPLPPPAKAARTSKPIRAPAATKKGKGKKASAVLTGPEVVPVATKKETAAATAAVVRETTPVRDEAVTTMEQSPPRSAPGAFPSPTPSMQSSHGSNAENEPPSTRPSATRPPLAALTPNDARLGNAHVGPSTPTTGGIYEDPDVTTATITAAADATPQWALQSGFPWRPVDVENVFLPSPEGKEKRWLGVRSESEDEDDDKNDRAKAATRGTPLSASKDVRESQKTKSKSGKVVKDGKGSGDAAHQEKIRAMAAALSAAEKDMTVEQWIRANAARGEQRLRDHCERVVGRFETEGIRAMKALEGLVVEEWGFN